MKWRGPHRRWDRDGLVEYHCKHGIGHPAYGSALWIAEERGWGVDVELVHGCDGCCSRKSFPGTPELSLVRAHALIREAQETVARLRQELEEIRMNEDEAEQEREVYRAALDAALNADDYGVETGWASDE